MRVNAIANAKLTGTMRSDPFANKDFLSMHDQNADADLDRFVCDGHYEWRVWGWFMIEGS